MATVTILPNGAKRVVVIGHGLAGRTVAETMRKQTRKTGDVEIVVVEANDFYEADAASTMFLAFPEVREKSTVPQWRLRVEGVRYVTDTVTAVRESLVGLDVALASGETLAANAVVCCAGFGLPVLKPTPVSFISQRNNIFLCWCVCRLLSSLLWLITFALLA
jgi:glycine/D-amino acid oxidase-like deaminating enzyme